jgi:hypothetical protein
MSGGERDRVREWDFPFSDNYLPEKQIHLTHGVRL